MRRHHRADTAGSARLVEFPAYLVAGEPALLVDRGYQKFFKTSKLEVAATAERLQALHDFSEELKLALGYTSLYNESLGSVSASYHYDRIVDRDLPETERPPAPGRNSSAPLRLPALRPPGAERRQTASTICLLPCSSRFTLDWRHPKTLDVPPPIKLANVSIRRGDSAASRNARAREVNKHEVHTQLFLLVALVALPAFAHDNRSDQNQNVIERLNDAAEDLGKLTNAPDNNIPNPFWPTPSASPSSPL